MDEIELFIKEYWSVFHTFMITQPNLRFIGKWKSATKLNFKQRYPEKVTIKNYELIAEMVTSAVNGAYAFWPSSPQKVSTKDLKAIMFEVMDSVIEIL